MLVRLRRVPLHVRRVLLIDGDIVAYQYAAQVEREIEWEDGIWSTTADADEAKALVEEWEARLQEKLQADELVYCMSDPARRNFRKEILPTYKANRAKTRPPMIRKELEAYLLAKPGAKSKPGIEADDVLGILATNPKLYPGAEKIIVTLDKDLGTIPGLLYNWKKSDAGVVEVSLHDADFWHLTQTLTGDVTDGYAGCPGVGKVKAEKILFGVSPPWGTVREAWAAVVDAFKKAGLGPVEALTQARVARILRHGEYDYRTNEPILWNPPTN